MQRPLTVAIAGATGFVGEALRRALGRRHRVIGLTRSRALLERPPREEGVEWRHCDLFSWRDLDRALAGADCGVYLVHSMLPSARLTQASFADLDLLLADNFARAAERGGLAQLVYVGGLTPPDEPLSPHLASRLEVERALASRGVPLTALRAGLIVGPGGSSLSILVNLVRRLPAMVLPRWTESRTQPIALADVVRAVELCVGDPATYGRTFDIGGPDVLTYRGMIARTGRVLGREPWTIGVPFFSPRLSRLWVSLFGGTSGALVGPLIESLRHDMVCRENPLQRRIAAGAQSFDAALRAAVGPGGRSRPDPRVRLLRFDRSALRFGRSALRFDRSALRFDRSALRRARTMRSVQRLVLPPGRDARWVAAEYLRFLPRYVRPLLRCEVEDRAARFTLRGTRLLLLELRHAADRSAADRQVFDVVGGRLVRRAPGPPGRLEFREVLGGSRVLAAVHDFRPALPFWLYDLTQARVHLWVMRGFGRHLRRVAAGERPALPAAAGRARRAG
jgi:uncharacterized protein YbjT (DUF2867 family)